MGVYAHTTSNVSESVRNKIARLPRGRVFSVDNIHVEGSHDTILRVLSRLVQEGKILRIQNSIYYKPEFNRFLKGRPVPPDVNEVIKVISNRNKETLQIHGSSAVNKLGLSTQVPLTKVFYTNGPSREVIIAGTRVKFIHTENQNILQASGTEVGMALSALIFLGREHVDQEVVRQVKSRLSENHFKRLKRMQMSCWLKERLSDPAVKESSYALAG